MQLTSLLIARFKSIFQCVSVKIFSFPHPLFHLICSTCSIRIRFATKTGFISIELGKVNRAFRICNTRELEQSPFLSAKRRAF